MGDGRAIELIELDEFQRYILGEFSPHRYEPFVVITYNSEQFDSMQKLVELKLVKFGSMSQAGGGSFAHLLTCTGKGAAMIRATWDADRKEPAPQPVSPSKLK